MATIESGRFVLRLVLLQSPQTFERLLADPTLEVPFLNVRLLVFLQGSVGEEGFVALITGEWSFPLRVDLHVVVVNVLGGELCGANSTFVRPFTCV